MIQRCIEKAKSKKQVKKIGNQMSNECVGRGMQVDVGKRHAQRRITEQKDLTPATFFSFPNLQISMWNSLTYNIKVQFLNSINQPMLESHQFLLSPFYMQPLQAYPQIYPIIFYPNVFCLPFSDGNIQNQNQKLEGDSADSKIQSFNTSERNTVELIPAPLQCEQPKIEGNCILLEEDKSAKSLKFINRNILPNYINRIMSFITRFNKSGKIVERLIQKHKQNRNYNVKSFYAYQKYLKTNISNVKAKNVIKKITTHLNYSLSSFQIHEQMFYNKICRILIQHFIEGNYIFNILAKENLTAEQKHNYLQIRRFILENLTQTKTRPLYLL